MHWSMDLRRTGALLPRRAHRAMLAIVVAVASTAACKGDDAPADSGTTAGSGTAGDEPSDNDDPGGNDNGNDNDNDNDMADDPDADDSDTTLPTDDPDDTDEDPGDDPGDDPDEDTGTPSDCEFSESFDGPDAGAWPAPWEVTGGVEIADVVGGRGRLVPFTSGYSLARIYAPLDCVDVEATFSFEFTDGNTQGAGFYVRHNGGHLMESNPTGQGYSTFVEAFRDPAGIGVWREVGGSEQLIESVVALPVNAGVRYRARLRVTQESASRTLLQARFWPESDAEPGAWQVERTDETASLQNTGGGIALDAWSSLTSGQASEMFFDDIVITAAP